MTILSGVRPRTLILSVAPVAIGGAAAVEYIETHIGQYSPYICAPERTPCGTYHFHRTTIPWLPTLQLVIWLLCLIVAVFMQIAANFANDYSDGIRGTDDARAESSPSATSAPTRLVASGTDPGLVLRFAGGSAFIACPSGVILTALTRQWWFIAVGVACLVAGWFYVGGKHPYGYRGLGGVAVFVFFGLVATLGTQYAMIGRLTPLGIVGAISAGASACAVLGINNLRDIESDTAAGKLTLAVRIGPKAARSLIAVETWASVVMAGIGSALCHSTLGMCGTILAGSVAALLTYSIFAPNDDSDFRAMFRQAVELSGSLALTYLLCTLHF